MNRNPYEGFFPGMAIGDALGAPAQGLKPVRVIQLFNRLDDFQEPETAFEHSPGNWRSKGLYSFPTQQALAVAESIILSKAYNIENIHVILKSLYMEQDGLYRGMDEVFRKAMHKPEKNPLSHGICHPGIGVISRCLVLALFFKDDETDLLRAILETSLLTNNDPRAIAGSAACTRAAWMLIRNPARSLKNSQDLIQNIKHFTRKSEEYLQDYYQEYLPRDLPVSLYYTISDSLDVLSLCLKEKNQDLAKQTILKEANRHQPPFPISVLNQDFAPSAVCHILYTLLSAKTFGMGLLDVINEGKEARAMGAIIGGLLGLRFGLSDLPEEWLSRIKNLDQLILKGRELYEGYADWNERRDLIQVEGDFTKKERKEIRIRREIWMQETEKEVKKHPPKAKQSSTINPNLPNQEEAPFAPPPSVVFGGNLPDPLKAKQEKVMRGRKRIEWKEHRRHRKRRK